MICMDTPETTARRISEAVKTISADRGVSQRQLSEATGIPFVTLHRRFNGGKPFDMAELAAIAAVLDMSVTDIITAALPAEVA